MPELRLVDGWVVCGQPRGEQMSRMLESGKRQRVACVAALLATGLSSCSGDGSSMPGLTVQQTVCVPGEVVACACSDEEQGTATCGVDGLAYGSCDCPVGSSALEVPGPTTGGTGAPQLNLDGSAEILDGDGTEDNVVASETDPVPAPEPIDVGARNIKISELAMYQAVKVTLAQDGEPVLERNAPVVVGKEAFLRVYVEPEPGFTNRAVRAVLTILAGEGVSETLSAEAVIAGASVEAQLESTINFDIPPELITAETRYSVALEEVSEATALAATSEPLPAARFPLADSADVIELGARDAGPVRVVLVPYLYGYDGTNRSPDISDEQVQYYRDVLYAYYPTSEIQLEVHEPVIYTGNVSPTRGWEQWLDAHCAFREEEAPDPKTLYYGVMNPRESLQAYGGGIVGISFLPGPAANWGRCSVGIGYTGGLAALTMAHELGHSLGLPHAPCGVDGGPYPYADGIIGSWGFGLGSRQLKPPDEYFDLMTYCEPAFISDYNFQKLFERIRYLNLQFKEDFEGLPEVTYSRVLQTSEGELSVVGTHRSAMPPGGEDEQRTVELFDAAGSYLGHMEAFFIPTGEQTAGVWFIPESPGAAVVELAPGEKVWLP